MIYIVIPITFLPLNYDFAITQLLIKQALELRLSRQGQGSTLLDCSIKSSLVWVF